MRHNKLDLNLLVALNALLEEASVSRAADRVFFTQSAMSNALGRLRRHFQDELIVQVGRKMVLTEKAQAIKDEVRSILFRISAVTRPVDAFDPRTASRLFRIAASDYFCSVVLPGLLRHLSVTAPAVHIDALPLGARLNEDLERGDVDLLIVPHIYTVKGYPTRTLFKDDWVCVVSKDNKSVGSRLSLKSFLAMEHVAKRENHPSFPPMDDWALSRARLKRHVAVRVPQYGLLPLSVVGTERIATLQRRLAEMYAAWLPLAVHNCPFDCPALEESMQWHAVREADVGHQWLRETIVALCNETSPRRVRRGAR